MTDKFVFFFSVAMNLAILEEKKNSIDLMPESHPLKISSQISQSLQRFLNYQK